MLNRIVLIMMIVTTLFFLVGCSDDISQIDPINFLERHVEGLRDVKSYKATLAIEQDFGRLGLFEWDIIIHENVEENSFHYLTSLESEPVMEIYQLDDIFTINFNIMGLTHSETFTGDDFAKTTNDIVIMEAFNDMSVFRNLAISEDRTHYLVVGESTLTNLIDNELISLEEFQYQLDDSQVEFYVSKRSNYIERVVLISELSVEGEVIKTKTELVISDINKVNNIKELVANK